MPFQIIAGDQGRLTIETRVMPASAAVLAMKWMSEGIQSVRIMADGRIYGVQEFRSRYLTHPSREGYVSTGLPTRANG